MQVRLPGNRGGTAEGVLSFVDNKIDPATGTVLVKADFANTDRDLWPGQLIPVSLRLTTSRDTLVVPSQAVQTGQDGSPCLRRAGGFAPSNTVRSRSVRRATARR